MFPPVVRPVAVRVQPATTTATVHAKQARTANGTLDGFMHGNDPPETHLLDLLVGKLLTDETGDFGVRGFEHTGGRECANLLGGSIVVLEEHALEDGNLGHDATSRLEVFGPEHALGIVPDPEAFLLEACDPFLAGRAVTRDREVDDTILLAPGTLGFDHDGFTTEKPVHPLFTSKLVPDRFNATQSLRVLCHMFSS